MSMHLLPEGEMASPIKTPCHNGGQRKRLDAKWLGPEAAGRSASRSPFFVFERDSSRQSLAPEAACYEHMNLNHRPHPTILRAR